MKKNIIWIPLREKLCFRDMQATGQVSKAILWSFRFPQMWQVPVKGVSCGYGKCDYAVELVSYPSGFVNTSVLPY